MEDEVSVQLQLLLDILAKKLNTLQEILSITENQGIVLKTQPEEREMFVQMVEEKQVRINSISTGDDIFNSIFAKIVDKMKNDKKVYKAYIAKIQFSIKRVLDMEIRIRLEERNNKKYIQNAINVMPMRIAANHYASQKKHTIRDMIKDRNATRDEIRYPKM